jgi:ubiquinone/menaquinone biosynthesis C-methylase UbiE
MMKTRRYKIGRIDGTLCAFSPEDIVLDAGTGKQGHFLKALSSKCKSVYAIDSNMRFLQNARSRIDRGRNIVLLNADLSRVPMRSGYFDKVFCLEVLEHVESPIDILGELYRILKPNGICVVAVPTYQSEALYSKLNPHYDRNKGEHITILKKQEWLSLFQEIGFELLYVRNEHFGPALYWIFRSVFPINYDPSSGDVLESKKLDKVFWLANGGINKITFGSIDGLGNKVFPKSWHFYLGKI